MFAHVSRTIRKGRGNASVVLKRVDADTKV